MADSRDHSYLEPVALVFMMVYMPYHRRGFEQSTKECVSPVTLLKKQP